MARFDFRGKHIDKPVCVYKGFSGGVRDIAIHPTLPVIASSSLDRHMRIHHLDEHTLLHKVSFSR